MIFEENAGFVLFYSIIKDALTSRIGVTKSWWEETHEVRETRHSGIAAEAFPLVRAIAEAEGAEVVEVEEGAEGFSFAVRRSVTTGRQRNLAVPPEDFTFAADTVSLREAKNVHMHHGVISRNGPIGRHVPDHIKNQLWNLTPLQADVHGRISHSFKGAPRFNRIVGTWVGMPPWLKAQAAAAGARAPEAVDNEWWEKR